MTHKVAKWKSTAVLFVPLSRLLRVYPILQTVAPAGFGAVAG